ncbi:hypothetical protein CABS01_10597, partial [Colletotrichum abscissum]|uniref:uncharacterized protein n=1 Tax=Colletotrichum abscissum TaxID=1671311 RepID=UPI0027D537B3
PTATLPVTFKHLLRRPLSVFLSLSLPFEAQSPPVVDSFGDKTLPHTWATIFSAPRLLALFMLPDLDVSSLQIIGHRTTCSLVLTLIINGFNTTTTT